MSNATETLCSFCCAPGARMGHDPKREADGGYDPCVGEPICETCRAGLELDADAPHGRCDTCGEPVTLHHGRRS